MSLSSDQMSPLNLSVPDVLSAFSSLSSGKLASHKTAFDVPFHGGKRGKFMEASLCDDVDDVNMKNGEQCYSSCGTSIILNFFIEFHRHLLIGTKINCWMSNSNSCFSRRVRRKKIPIKYSLTKSNLWRSSFGARINFRKRRRL